LDFAAVALFLSLCRRSLFVSSRSINSTHGWLFIARLYCTISYMHTHNIMTRDKKLTFFMCMTLFVILMAFSVHGTGENNNMGRMENKMNIWCVLLHFFGR